MMRLAGGTTPDSGRKVVASRGGELGRLLREAVRLLEQMDLRGANEALKKATALPDVADRQDRYGKLRE